MELPIETMNFIRRENPDSTNSCGVFVQSRSLMAERTNAYDLGNKKPNSIPVESRINPG